MKKSFFREGNEQIGGPGVVIEIDETKIGHRKYQRGRLVDGAWILGIIEPETGKYRLEVCPDNKRDSSTLLTLIQKHVRQGSIIHTDCWRGYSKLQDNGYEHRTVNHSENFVDPSTGTHTQNIESSWRALKRRVTRGGVMHDALYRHFAEYIWMQNHKEDVFYSFCRAIAKTFKV